MKIDAHHHFWHYNTQDYGWISDEMAVLRRDFLPADLKPELDRAGIDRVVSVQARQCIEKPLVPSSSRYCSIIWL